MPITIKLALTSAPSSPRVPLAVDEETTPNGLRALAAEASRIPPATLRLIFRGRLVKASDEGSAVTEYLLEEGCVVHCMGKPESGGGGAPSSASASASASAAAPAGNAAGPAAAAAAGAAVVPPPPTAAAAAAAAAAPGSPLAAALAKIRAGVTGPSYVTALTTLEKLLTNIVSNPTEEKYRRVKRGNAAFQKRLGGLPGGHDAVLASGFVLQDVNGTENYVLVPSAEAWPRLVECRDEVAAEASAARIRSAAAPVPAAPSASPFGVPPPALPGAGLGGMPGMAGMPGMPPGGGMASLSPEMQRMAAGLMSDPNQLRSIMQSPMFRQMMDQDPRLAGNPQARRAMEQILSDPNGAEQMSRMMADPMVQSMMSNPQLMQQMQQMAGGAAAAGGGGVGGVGGAGQQAPDPAAMASMMRMMQQQQQQGGASSAGAAGQQGQGQQQQQQGGNDDELTEEEMIQEAIRRSLQDNGS